MADVPDFEPLLRRLIDQANADLWDKVLDSTGAEPDQHPLYDIAAAIEEARKFAPPRYRIVRFSAAIDGWEPQTAWGALAEVVVAPDPPFPPGLYRIEADSPIIPTITFFGTGTDRPLLWQGGRDPLTYFDTPPAARPLGDTI